MRVVTIQQAPLHTTLLSDSRGTPQPLPRDLLRGQKVLLGEAECALHQRGDFPSPILAEYPSSRNCARILSERVILGLMTRVVASVSQVQSWKVNVSQTLVGLSDQRRRLRRPSLMPTR